MQTTVILVIIKRNKLIILIGIILDSFFMRPEQTQGI